MRVAFCGASGTGKSELARYLVEKKGLELNPVGSRSVSRAMGFDTPYGVDAAGRRAEFQRRLIAEKRAWENERESFVTDRTTLDNLAYTIMHGVEAIDEELFESAIDGMRRYDHVVYCPVRTFCNPGDDPARVKDLTYHHLFDAVLVGLLSACQARFLVPVRTMAIVGLEARKARLDAIL